MPLKSNALVPELLVSDLKRSLSFYCDVLGFKIEFIRPEDGFAYLSFGGSQLMLEQDNPKEESLWKVGAREYPRGQGMNFSIDCVDAVQLADTIVQNKFPLQKPVEERWYRSNESEHGEKNFLVLDPDGFMLRFKQRLGVRVVGG